MQDLEDFYVSGEEVLRWIEEYYRKIESLPVKSISAPREVYHRLPARAPEKAESLKEVMDDLDRLIMPGITHWQHPRFFAYFNANASFPSVLGELLTSAIGAQCMIWDTSPAAAELEERMMDWMKAAMQLPDGWHGVIQDTASTATLCALLTAREFKSDYRINESGFQNQPPMTVYCSAEAHSSIEKAVKIAGFGRCSLRKIAVDASYAMLPEALEQAIREDIGMGFRPVMAVAAAGTTGSLAMDPLAEIGAICRNYGLWYHIDAALAGNAAILPEFRSEFNGLEMADSYVFNPHKWMFTNFDCSLYFVRDAEALIRTFEIMPEYLKSTAVQVNNYRDWGIQLGRRFRALKLWFVLRLFGLEGIREKFRLHIRLAQHFRDRLLDNGSFEILAPLHFNLVCFRYRPAGDHPEERLDALNMSLLQAINASGRAYITHTRLGGKYTLRASIGQTNVEQRHVDELFDLLVKLSGDLE
jgi:aromatic-L-amino-acid/L-tryptophan decarboxylase